MDRLGDDVRGFKGLLGFRGWVRGYGSSTVKKGSQAWQTRGSARV